MKGQIKASPYFENMEEELKIQHLKNPAKIVVSARPMVSRKSEWQL